MKISSKLLLSFGFINLLILLSSTLVYYRLTQINQAQHTLLEQALHGHFEPEFLNRIDEIVEAEKL